MDVNNPVIIDPRDAIIAVTANGVSITDAKGNELVRIDAADDDPEAVALFIRQLTSVSAALSAY